MRLLFFLFSNYYFQSSFSNTRLLFLYLKILSVLPHKVKTQYAQILNIVDTLNEKTHLWSIYFHAKKVVYIHMFDMQDTSTNRLLNYSEIFQSKRKYSAYDLKWTYCVFTLRGRLVKKLDCLSMYRCMS